METTPRIVITGPESTGKTTLAARLADRCQTIWVPEYARVHLDRIGRPYREADLLDIAAGQYLWRKYGAALARQAYFCDTDMLVLKIWSEFRYGRCHPWILDQLRHDPPSLYLLCAADLPWTPDPLRENPHDREQLFVLYERALLELGHSYVTISGAEPRQRLAQAMHAVSEVGG